jgi:hypothetical protein
MELTPVLSIGIFVGILTAFVCITFAVLAALKFRTTQHHQQQKNTKTRPGNLAIKEKISLPISQSEDMYDEKNPDVVPTNEGKRKR